MVFVWNALPGETVAFRVIKQKRAFIEAIAEDILVSSPDRVAPLDDIFLSTSPWQILSTDGEKRAKLAIVEELMEGAKVRVPSINYHDSVHKLHYRNKMEYSFWGDDSGLHLALHNRGSHAKQIVNGSSLAMVSIDTAARSLIDELMRCNVRAGDLKTVVIRSNRRGDVAMSLFVKQEDFTRLRLPKGVGGLNIYYSDPKSPASVATKLLMTYGSVDLEDELNGKVFVYSADAFFQVNLDVFEQVLEKIKAGIDLVAMPVVDMFSGVGSIGLSLGAKEVKLVEINKTSADYAVINAKNLNIKAQVVVIGSENALDLIPAQGCVIFDPPRAGLHRKIVDQLLIQKPTQIVYLSCNPATLARDLGLLQADYAINSLDVYNFFPKTPHIESLAILSRKAN